MGPIMKRLRVFVSSTMRPEFKAEREFVDLMLDGLGFDPVMFEAAAETGPPAAESLHLVAESDVFVQLLWLRYSRIVVQEYETAVESGKPIAFLLKEPSADEQRDTDLTAFIERIRRHHTYKTYRGLRQLRERLSEALQSCLSRVMRSTVRTMPSKHLHLAARELLQRANNVSSYALTPVLLTGPRPYLGPTKSTDEQTAYTLQQQLVESARRGKRTFSLAFSGRALIEEVRRVADPVFAERILNSLEELRRRQGEHLAVGCSHPDDRHISRFTYLAADESSILLIRPPDSRSHYVFTEAHQQLATSLSLLAAEIIGAAHRARHLDALYERIQSLPLSTNAR